MRNKYFGSVLLSILLVTSIIAILSFSKTIKTVSASSSTTLNPTNDAEIVESSPNTPQLDIARVGIRSYNAGRNIRSFLRFDLSGLPSNALITNATLRLFQYSLNNYIAGVVDAQVQKVSNDSWDENTITWNNAPPMGNLIGTIVCGPGGINPYVWRELDVTSYVQSERAVDNQVSLALMSVLENYDVTARNAYFRSKEATDNYPQLVVTYTTEYYEKYCMPDLGQHSVNWCWVAAAANSLYWYSQHGYLQLIDDPADPTPNDNRYITDPLRFGLGDPTGYYRLFDEIASDCGHVWNEGILDNEYFYGLQKFINEQGAPLIVHEIVDPTMVSPVPPPIENLVIYRPPTLVDYQKELENCQDVLLWLKYKHENSPYWYEETAHVVTGVGFTRDNMWIYVSDPWTPGTPMPPNHSNDLTHTLTPYDYLHVMSAPNENLWVIYDGLPRQVVKMIFISPEAPANYGVDAGISSPFQSGLPGMTLSCTAWVTNTGNVQDTYTLTAIDNAGWNPTGFPPSITVAAGMTWLGSVDVTIPLNTPSGTIDNITFTAAGTGVSDTDSCIAQVTTYFIKYCMPDLGQHSANWCWVAAAANSIYWYSQHGYLQLIDAPENAVVNDNNYITQMIPVPDGHNVYRLFWEIASDCGHGWNEGILDNEYYFGLQKFMSDQGAPLKVHEIVNPALVLSPPPASENVIYRSPTLTDYESQLENCQDVLLWLHYRHTEGYSEDTDHVVTGVGFSYDNQYLIVSDPWTPGAPDHSNDLTHTLTPYDDLQVISVDPLLVLYNGMPVQVSKMIFVSPENVPTVPYTGTATFRLENLYKVSLEKNLQINTGSKLIVKFYDYSNTYESENIFENNFALPLSIVDNENVPHPANGSLPVAKAVKKAELVLTTNNENEVISTIASFTVHQSDLRTRYGNILRVWGGQPGQQSAFRTEIGDIMRQWSSAPT